ncbi:hypothetical protein SCLCIDRAFT_20693 [Scleroderma citrinum Foug A]|uniref:Uncharacterized protein n=1 Tax=Scleroderma citrinum Foug A TaxID=1036808 RepID=A0A0C3A3T6_9AGAM|nr:hypothetical protein SCLCIDRAFT_20693 [Scleroderma citrinum Foug A]
MRSLHSFLRPFLLFVLPLLLLFLLPPSCLRPASVFPPPASVFPPPASVFPPPASVFPPPASVFPPPASVFPPPASVFPPPASVFPPPASVSLPPVSLLPVSLPPFSLPPFSLPPASVLLQVSVSPPPVTFAPPPASSFPLRHVSLSPHLPSSFLLPRPHSLHLHLVQPAAPDPAANKFHPPPQTLPPPARLQVMMNIKTQGLSFAPHLPVAPTPGPSSSPESEGPVPRLQPFHSCMISMDGLSAA